MKSLVKGIFICLFAIFLMSHNAFAADIVNDDVSLFNSVTSLQFSCSVNGSNFIQNTGSCHLGANAAVPVVKFKPNASDLGLVDTDTYYVEVYLRIANNANTPAPVWYGAGSGDRMTFVSEEQVSSTTSNNITYRTYRLLYKFYGNTVNWNTQPASIYNAGDIFAAESFKVMGMIFWRVDNSGNDSAAIVQAINNQTQYLQDISQNLYIADTHLDAIEDYLEYIHDHLDELQEAIEENNQAEQDSVDNIENQSPSDIDSGDNSSATNLIGNIGNIFTQIQNIPASSTCSVPADFGHLNLGNINFCSGKENLPFVVTFGAYVFEFVFVVGCSIIIVKRVLSLYDWSRR